MITACALPAYACPSQRHVLLGFGFLVSYRCMRPVCSCFSQWQHVHITICLYLIPSPQLAICIERIPFGLGIFHFPHLEFVRFSPTMEAFSRPFSGSPANPRISNARFACISGGLSARFFHFTTGMLRQNPISQTKRDLLYLLPSSRALSHNIRLLRAMVCPLPRDTARNAQSSHATLWLPRVANVSQSL